MVVKDNKTGLPLEHYGKLFAAADPAEMSARSGASFESGVFRLRMFGRKVEITYPDMRITWAETGAELRPYARILLARYLLEGRRVPPSGKMISYSEKPWGDVYIQSFRGRCLARIAFGFGKTPQKFEEGCLALGGVHIGGSGLAFDIPFLEGFTVRPILWEGEDDIPPAAQFLFSDNFPDSFSAEDMAVVGDIVVDALKGRM